MARCRFVVNRRLPATSLGFLTSSLRSGRMPRWVPIVIVAPLALCVTCAVVGSVVVVPRIRTAISKTQTSVANAMADAVATSVGANIAASTRPPGEFVLAPADLNVNNAAGDPGQCGYETGTPGTRIYGVETEIGPAGIAIVCIATYS